MAGTGKAHLRPGKDAVLQAEDVTVQYTIGRGRSVHAVSGVSLDILPGETLGLVGESGCGKSSMAKAVMQLPAPTAGSIRLEGTELTSLKAEELRRTRPMLQMLFQDPISSLNPHRRVKDIVAEGPSIWGTKEKATVARVEETLAAVGLDPQAVWDRRPSELSGGQCQRLSIARALMLNPRMLVCDEPVSALDVSVQAQILNLLEDAKERYGLSMLFIAHDLSVVKNISDRVMVMYLGKVCEVAPSDGLHQRAAHPYTLLLLESIPTPEKVRVGVDWEDTSDLPSPLNPPSGCRFRTRCPLATEQCAVEEPVLREAHPGHFVACHHPMLDTSVTVEKPAGVDAV